MSDIVDFVAAPLPADEAGRLAALKHLRVLDTPAEPIFDDVVWLASSACNASIALISLIDTDRQWFKAQCGLEGSETSRDLAFCAYTILGSTILEIPDTLLDPQFATHPAVTGEPRIRFYAGAPLIGRTGHAYGTLCVADAKPSKLDERQREALTRLARQAVSQLEARQDRLDARANKEELAQILEAMPDGVVTCNAEGLLQQFNRMAREWHGTDPQALPPGQWARHFGLYRPGGEQPLATEEIPLLRAWKGEVVRDAEIVIKAAGQPARTVLCNADPLGLPGGESLGAVCVMRDVTDQRVAQEAARLASERFGGAFAAAAQGMAFVSLQGRWLEVNESLCRILGYSRDELLVTSFQQLTHRDDLEADLELVQELIDGKRTQYHLNKRYFHKDGRTVYALLAVSLVRDARGQPLHFVSQIQDVTEQHTAQERIRDSESRVRTILENSHDAFIAIDEAGRIVEWNRSAEAAFGWRRSEALGRPMAELIVPSAMREAHRAGMQRFMASGERRVLDRRVQLPAIHRSGREFPVELTISEVRHGGRRLFTAFLHDISDRLEAEQRLRDSEARMRLVTDNVPALIAYVGKDRRYRFANQGYHSWLALGFDAIEGRHMREVLGQALYDQARPHVERVLAGEQVEFERDYPLPEGGVRHTHVTYLPDRRDGETEGFYALIQDVTAHKRLAEVLQSRAMRDELTGLPNRAAWREELDRGLARANRAGVSAAVMFLDLDGFKQINDTYGHEAGDAVLCEFARRLTSTLRRNDLVARLAGDEFVVLLDQVADLAGHPPVIAQKILDAAESGFDFNGHRLPIRPSIGIAVQAGPDFSAECLMRRADEAMYRAKRSPAVKYEVLDC